MDGTKSLNILQCDSSPNFQKIIFFGEIAKMRDPFYIYQANGGNGVLPHLDEEVRTASK
jgi:hypothetical protein